MFNTRRPLFESLLFFVEEAITSHTSLLAEAIAAKDMVEESDLCALNNKE